MEARGPINIHAKFQVDRSTHNENLGEESNEPSPPPLETICLAKRLEALRVKYEGGEKLVGWQVRRREGVTREEEEEELVSR